MNSSDMELELAGHELVAFAVTEDEDLYGSLEAVMLTFLVDVSTQDLFV